MIDAYTTPLTPADSISDPYEIVLDKLDTHSLRTLCYGPKAPPLINRDRIAAIEITLSTAGDSHLASTSEVTGTVRYLEPSQSDGSPPTPMSDHPLISGQIDSPIDTILDDSIEYAKSLTVDSARASRTTIDLHPDARAYSTLGGLIETLASCQSSVYVQVVLVPLGQRLQKFLSGEGTSRGSFKTDDERVGTNPGASNVGVTLTVAGTGSQNGSGVVRQNVDDVAKQLIPNHNPSHGSITSVRRDPSRARALLDRPDLRPEPTGLCRMSIYGLHRLPPLFTIFEAVTPVSIGRLPMVIVDDDDLSWLLGDR